MTEIGIDIISDLNLGPNDPFSWDGKATSLYCVVAGNISTDMDKVMSVLFHLSKLYHGVFFVPGKLEYEDTNDIGERTYELAEIASMASNIFMLHQSVVVIDGVALLGANGWSGIEGNLETRNRVRSVARYEDFLYLQKTITKLQRYLDVKKVVLVTNEVPHDSLYFNERPKNNKTQIPLQDILKQDTEKKVTNWIFGSYAKPVDSYIDNVNYLNNPYSGKSPYWAKRLTILL